MGFNEIIEAIGKPYFRDDSADIAIYCGDCRELLPKIPDKSIDLVLTDPPYGINMAANPFRQKFEKADWDVAPIENHLLLKIISMAEYSIIWGGNYFDLPPSQCFFIWDKMQPQNFSSSMCEYAWCNRQSPAKIYKKWCVGYTKYHPTQKPEPLMEWCLGMFPDSNLILDPFMGSGTTIRAALNLGRKCIGIEIEEKYCEIAAKRLSQSVMIL
jgi:DNA modification methylase